MNVQWLFIGSPTIRIDGRDSFATSDELPEPARQVFSTPGGRSGSRTVVQLLEVLS